MHRVLRFVAIWLVAMLVVLAGIGLFHQANTTIPQGVGGRQVEVAGIPLRVVQRGSGPDVLLIHGSPGCIEDWDPLIDALAPHRRVTAYDRPGHGYSGDDGEYSYAHNAEIALALVAKLGLRDVTAVGHSFGGATVLTLALRASPAIGSYWFVDG